MRPPKFIPLDFKSYPAEEWSTQQVQHLPAQTSSHGSLWWWITRSLNMRFAKPDEFPIPDSSATGE
jgi:hypothetical protein